jgi:hypothetical protein
MFLFSRFASFRPFVTFGVLALLVACSSTTSSSPQTECTSQSYPNLACASIKSCATGKGGACTGTTLELPDGRKFNCASCSDCKTAQEEAIAACDNKPASTPEADASTPEADSGAPTDGT